MFITIWFYYPQSVDFTTFLLRQNGIFQNCSENVKLNTFETKRIIEQIQTI